MSLQRYLRALARYWYIPAAFVLAGALGTWIYLKFNLGQKAVVTVAVLEPSITNNLNGGQAQVNFGSIAESRAVAERVVRELRLDMEPEALQANINVELARTLIPSVASPLYTVQIENPDGKLALRIAQAVVGQSRAVFQQLNAPDLGALEVMLAPQETELREQLTLAHGDLRDFEETSRAWLLPLQIEHQMHLIQALRESSGLALATDEVEQELETTLSQAQTELDALYTLLPEYERLSLDATVAIDRMLILSDAKTLRDFSLRPSNASSQIEDSLDAWHEARTALLNFTAEDVGVEEPPTETVSQDAYDRWTKARTAVLRTIAADPVRSAGEEAVLAGADESVDTLGLLDLPQRLENQQTFVETVQHMLLANRIQSMGYEAALAVEEAELERQLRLLPQYEILAARVTQLEQALQMGAARRAQLLYEASLPAAAQVKVLDPAHIESSFLDVLFPVVLSMTFSLAAAAGMVYLLGYFVHVPFSSEDVRNWLGVPILASLPRGKRRPS
jgi:capsular polysaccharide biosynthesis protein